MLSYVFCGLDHSTLARFHIPDSSNCVNHLFDNSKIVFVNVFKIEFFCAIMSRESVPDCVTSISVSITIHVHR